MEWVDAHTHLDSGELYASIHAVLDRALTVGVKRLLLVNSESSEQSFSRTQECRELPHPIERFVSYGIHPHEASLYSDVLEARLRAYLQRPGVIAFGEIGLDFYYNHSPHETQVEVLKKQLRIALEKSLPVVIHCRDAYARLAEILSEEQTQWRGMIHCFTGTAGEAERLLELGFFISFSGIVTFRNATGLREAAAIVPIDRMLIETDAPYLAPLPHRGKTNEPAYVVHTGNFLAELKKETAESFSHQISQNFSELFGV